MPNFFPFGISCRHHGGDDSHEGGKAKRGGCEKVVPSAKRPKTGRNKGPSCFPFLLMKEKNRTGAAQMGGKKKNHTTLYCIHVLFTSLDSRAFLSSLILVFSHHE